MRKKITDHSNKICVVGAGPWELNHIRTLHELNALAGIVEINSKRKNNLKSKYPYVKSYISIQEAIEQSFDGFVVATPAETHYEIAKLILERGKHVLVEKPLALTVKEAVELNNIANRKKVNLMVGHLLLFHPAIIKIKELIQNDKIGDIQYLYSHRLNLGKVRINENVLWSFAPHDIATFQYLLEKDPIEISCNGGAYIQPKIHDTTITILRYPNNINAHIFVNWLHPFKEHRLVITGTKGMFYFDATLGYKSLIFYDKRVDMVNGIPTNSNDGEEIIYYQEKSPLTEELKYFISRLNHNGIYISSAESAIKVLEIIETATYSLYKNSHV